MTLTSYSPFLPVSSCLRGVKDRMLSTFPRCYGDSYIRSMETMPGTWRVLSTWPIFITILAHILLPLWNFLLFPHADVGAISIIPRMIQLHFECASVTEIMELTIVFNSHLCALPTIRLSLQVHESSLDTSVCPVLSQMPNNKWIFATHWLNSWMMECMNHHIPGSSCKAWIKYHLSCEVFSGPLSRTKDPLLWHISLPKPSPNHDHAVSTTQVVLCLIHPCQVSSPGPGTW